MLQLRKPSTPSHIVPSHYLASRRTKKVRDLRKKNPREQIVRAHDYMFLSL
jgi:hypothetical protein